MPVQTFSLAADGDKHIGKHFKVKEFACRDGSDLILISTETVELLDKVREYYNAPVTINSGYRTPEYNRRINGAKHSQHCKGTAADFVVNGLAPQKVQADIRAGRIFGPHRGGLGSYPNFTHLDTGPKREW